MNKRKLDKTDIGEMHCWANSAFHSGFPKVQVDSDHMIELCERALDNSRLTEENAKLREVFQEVKRMLLQEREWRLEDCEIGGCEAKESLDTLSYNVDKLLDQLKEQNNDK